MIADLLQSKKILYWMKLKEYAFNVDYYCFTENGYVDTRPDNSGVRGVGIVDILDPVLVENFSPRYQFGFNGWGYFT